MKKFTCFLGLALSLSAIVHAQRNLVFRGTVKCFTVNDPGSTKGANNVVVVPAFLPNKMGVTGEQGYYEVATGMPIKKLDGKYVILYYLSRCKDCNPKRNVFVSEEQMRLSADERYAYLGVETVQMAAGCRSTELKGVQSDSIMNAVMQQPAQDLERVSGMNVLTPAPGFLNFLVNLAATTAVGGQNSAADTLNILPGRMAYGDFLFASPLRLSGNTGFNFSPHRNLSEAVFWNPSALALSYNDGGVFFFTNLKNNHKFSAFGKVSEQFAVGIGGLYTKQEEFRDTRFDRAFGIGRPPNVATHRRNLKEYAFYLSPSFLVNERLSFGASVKSIWQEFNRPDSLFVSGTFDNPTNMYRDGMVSESHIDGDVSASYRLLPELTLGLNVMNIGGSKLYADALPARKKIVPMKGLRSVGIGAHYKMKQFHFGADALMADGGFYDLSVGANYVPFNNALLSGGYAIKSKSYSLGFRLKYFQLTYVDDKDFLIDDRRQGKSGIFNGRLHSGFALNL